MWRHQLSTIKFFPFCFQYFNTSILQYFNTKKKQKFPYLGDKLKKYFFGLRGKMVFEKWGKLFLKLFLSLFYCRERPVAPEFEYDDEVPGVKAGSSSQDL